ncbi:hypothetical protein K505DRAFT_322375 [Melanomma pulvis-pyrius CBS 109.77]|uniref:Uncharacterized protein n=1 Tax=Melanomma pulvis-pyrius CBS 109.77 TaxID=1314802 RepID=A0A6A6XP20_9PLEO|nr:hypothetical protein K505DRAFT_322375 [Melanomma pulvis-pyrius CBS 109.77]
MALLPRIRCLRCSTSAASRRGTTAQPHAPPTLAFTILGEARRAQRGARLLQLSWPSGTGRCPHVGKSGREWPHDVGKRGVIQAQPVTMSTEAARGSAWQVIPVRHGRIGDPVASTPPRRATLKVTMPSWSPELGQCIARARSELSTMLATAAANCAIE